MKTILFFDRCDLTRLYILLSKELKGKANVIHVAFSEKEAKELADAGITNFIDYQKELDSIVDMLEPSEALIKEIDGLIIKESKGMFSLNASIQSDRGYSVLTYNEALKLACCHYSIWKRILSKQQIDIMYHEPASQFMTHIAAILCKSQGGTYITQTQLQGDKNGFWYLDIDGENFCCKEVEEKLDYYRAHPEEIDLERCITYISNFRKDYSVAFGDIVKTSFSKKKLYYQALKSFIIKCKFAGKYDRLKNNINYWSLRNNNALRKLQNLRQYKKNHIIFSKPIEGERYFYYSVHLEPEATVLYLSGGIYTNQIKLIENIAAMLPPGYYLYVKDHPHEFAYRKADDYERLIKIPNIRLIDQRIPGKRLIAKSIGVFSIVGTATFEGLMLGKQAYCFGKTYYTPCSRVSYVENIKDLRKTIYDNLKREYTDDVELYAYVNSYLESLRSGFVAYYGMDRIRNAGINEEINAVEVANNILE